MRLPFFLYNITQSSLSTYMELKNELLRTLSFYEPMSLEYIFLDLDKSFLDTHTDLTTEDLIQALSQLKSSHLVKEITSGETKSWIRIPPKKSFLRLLREKFKL